MSSEFPIVSSYFSKTYSFVYNNASFDFDWFYSKHLLLLKGCVNYRSQKVYNARL